MGLTCYDGHDFQHYTVADGLGSNYVRTLLEDCDGVIWAGTDDGLSRFDGDHFTTFRLSETGSNSVRALLSTPSRPLVVGVWGGLYQGLPGAFTRLGIGDTARALVTDPNGGLWVGTGTGPRRIGGDGVDRFSALSGLPSDLVTSMTVDRDGDVWAGTNGGGVCRYDGIGWRTYTTTDGLPDDRIATLSVDGDGALWVGTVHDGAARFDGEGFTAFTTRDGLAANTVADIASDLEGGLWFACWHGGLSYLHPGVSLLTDSPVQEAMTRDPEGRMWWGSGATLHCVSDSGASAHVLPSRVLCVLPDSQGRLWVGTHGGVYRFADRCNLAAPEHIFGEKRDGDTMALEEDPTGAVWVGSERGLWRCDGATTRVFTAADGLPGDHVSAVCVGRDGTVWCGSYNGGGLGRYDGDEWRVYDVTDGLAHDAVLDITQAQDGRLWIGTRGGLSCLADGAFTSITAADGLPAQPVKRVRVADNGHVWVATLGGGVARYDGENIQILTEADGLPSNCVPDLALDPGGGATIATFRGICRYRPSVGVAPGIEITEAEGRARELAPRSVQVAVGSGLRIAYRGTSLATTQMRYRYTLEGYDDGWSSTWDQTVRYDDLPVGDYTFHVVAVNRDLVVSSVPASLAVRVLADPRDERIAALRDTVRRREEVHRALVDAMPDVMFRVTRDGRFTHFEQGVGEPIFAAPDEYIGRRVQDIWGRDEAADILRNIRAARATGAVQTHGYSQTVAGETRHYEIRYTRCGRDEVLAIVRDVAERVAPEEALRAAEEERGALLQQVLTMQEEERSAIATALHEGIGQELVALQMALRGMESTSTFEEARGMLVALRRDVGLTSEALRQLSMDLRPSALSDVGLCAALRYEATAMEQKTGVEISFWADQRAVPRMPAGAESRIFRVARAALQNAVGPGRAGSISISVAGVDGGVHIVIEDDGVGFDVDAVMAGPVEARFGLTAMQEQLRPLGGVVTFNSSPDLGTVVGIDVPAAGTESS
jgi:PAS domain S-box-containing protein